MINGEGAGSTKICHVERVVNNAILEVLPLFLINLMCDVLLYFTLPCAYNKDVFTITNTQK